MTAGRSLVTVLAAASALVSFSGFVLAEEAGEPPEEGTAPNERQNASCFPACRAGYLCHEGQCVSMCNPPCGPNEACVDGTRCEYGGAAVPRVYEPPPPPPPPGFAERQHSALGFHLGFGGEVEDNAVTRDLVSTLGFNIRADFPVVEYLLLGPLFQFGAWRPDGNFGRSYYVDVDLFVRGRVPIELDSIAFQVWGGFPVGLTLDFLGDAYGSYDGFGLGWNIGLLAGGAIHFSKSFGMFAEIGWLQHKVSHDARSGSNDLDLRLSQGNFNVGFIFAK